MSKPDTWRGGLVLLEVGEPLGRAREPPSLPLASGGPWGKATSPFWASASSSSK